MCHHIHANVDSALLELCEGKASQDHGRANCTTLSGDRCAAQRSCNEEGTVGTCMQTVGQRAISEEAHLSVVGWVEDALSDHEIHLPLEGFHIFELHPAIVHVQKKQ